MYFHTDDPGMLDLIARVAMLAEENYQSLRIDVDNLGRLKVKVGESGMWTAPLSSTPDSYRDNSPRTGNPTTKFLSNEPYRREGDHS